MSHFSFSRLGWALTFGLTLGLTSCVEEVPVVTFSAPAEGSSFASTDIVTFIFDVDNFDLDEEAFGDEAEAGHGHIHLFLDEGETAVKTSTSATVDLDLSTLVLTPGLHTFRAALFENDHTPVENATADVLEVTIATP